MTETIAFKNTYMCYIDNNPYQYPSIHTRNLVETTTNGETATVINTGWHIIPNFLWRHVCIPRQWASLVMGCEAYTVKAIRGVIYNPIPITTNISLQRVSQFSAFNNCTYAMTYDDNKYETQWFQWNELPFQNKLCLAQREGLVWSGTQTGTSSSDSYHAARYQWPIFHWRLPNMKSPWHQNWSQGKGDDEGVFDDSVDSNWHHSIPGGIFWDPFNCPEEIGELRAGKNSISFEWNVHASDDGKWFNLDALAAYAEWTPDGPYCGVGRPWTLKRTFDVDPAVAATFGLASAAQAVTDSDLTEHNDYSIPNMFNLPIVPTKWFWIEVGKSVADWTGENSANNTSEPFWKKIDKYWHGTEYEAYAYPPTQWFCKGIPLYAADNNPIKTSTQISFEITVILEGRKRRSAYFAPTHGPWSGEQLYYHSNLKGIFQPNCIRYRSGGRRRTWQNMTTRWKENMNTTTAKHNLATNPRKDNYLWTVNTQSNLQYNNKHAPLGINDYAGANPATLQTENYAKLKVKWTRDTDETEIIMEEDEPTEEEERPQERQRVHKTPSILKLMQLK